MNLHLGLNRTCHNPQASLYTDGSLNLGICTLHSFDMLRGGFNWIFMGLVIDVVLEWKPTWITMLGDARLEGWINMVPVCWCGLFRV